MKQALQVVLAGYKRWISPMLPNACRFVPTCSEYASEAIEQHGALRGSILALGRLLRCHPLAKAGHDPVPQQLGFRNSSMAQPGCCQEDHARSRAKHNDEVAA